jgi:hypothetical protein
MLCWRGPTRGPSPDWCGPRVDRCVDHCHYVRPGGGSRPLAGRRLRRRPVLTVDPAAWRRSASGGRSFQVRTFAPIDVTGDVRTDISRRDNAHGRAETDIGRTEMSRGKVAPPHAVSDNANCTTSKTVATSFAEPCRDAVQHTDLHGRVVPKILCADAVDLWHNNKLMRGDHARRSGRSSNWCQAAIVPVICPFATSTRFVPMNVPPLVQLGG